MDTLRKLDIVRLIKELDFVESEYFYRSEVIREIDNKFREEVENVLNSNLDLKEVFTKRVDQFTKFQIPTEPIFEEQTQELLTIDKNPKVKNLYRTIAKTTHPDKVNDESLKELYLEATKAYESNELAPLISICDKLKIPFDLDNEEYESIRKKIQDLKNRTNFLETTYPWQWHNQENESNKNKIVLKFIQSQII